MQHGETPAVQSSPFFVAYVYPGWHRSAYRPSVDEWELLANYKPYFDGHQPPPAPLDGPYDDSEPATALQQIQLARSFGIDAFSYFLYYQPDDFVLSEPIDAAFRSASGTPGFAIGLTWCIRLPHREFPIRARRPFHRLPPVRRTSHLERLLVDGRNRQLIPGSPAAQPTRARDDEVGNLTLVELERLVGSQLFDQIPLDDVIKLLHTQRRAAAYDRGVIQRSGVMSHDDGENYPR